MTTPAKGQAAWVQVQFDRPFSARALTISARAGNRNGVPVGVVLAGNSATTLRHWRRCLDHSFIAKVVLARSPSRKPPLVSGCIVTRLLEQRGMGIYSEAAGVSLEIPEDTLLNKKNVTIPMGEFWVHDLHPRLMYYQDIRGAASASHVYGEPLTAAESFTGGGYESPFSLKKVSDYWLAQGVNRMVFHTSAHQPLDTKPGNTMVGTHINRNIMGGTGQAGVHAFCSPALHAAVRPIRR